MTRFGQPQFTAVVFRKQSPKNVFCDLCGLILLTLAGLFGFETFFNNLDTPAKSPLYLLVLESHRLSFDREKGLVDVRWSLDGF